MPQSSYYRNAQPGEALLRARQAYLVPNVITGACIFGLAIGIYAFTIRAVSQDEFEDVPIPDAPPQPAAAPHSGINRSAGATNVGT
ncbi:MAG: hypothetical protein M1828_006284 [Chrysothrix sp. TS-e1954]|nr:MAG: hypothetical protein M1828_006284 [Chrysothrix sp. TS-e1954]